MNYIPHKDNFNMTKVLLLVAVLCFSISTVLAKLGRDWWTDENYSHGLLVPFVIGLIIWREWYDLRRAATDGASWLGGAICIFALTMLIAGVLGPSFS